MGKKSNTNIQELLLVEIMRTSHLLVQPMNIIFKKFDLTQSQYNILRILRGASPDPISAGTIKERMVNPKSDTTRLMDRLVAKGLIKRKLKKDNRRTMNIEITNKGLKLLDKMAPEVKNLMNQFKKGLKNKEKVESFLAYLKEIQEQTLTILAEDNV